MTSRTVIDPDMAIDEVMRKWPSTIPVVIRRKMLCVGCPIGIFHTVAEACRAHGLEQAPILAELERAALASRNVSL